MRGTPFQRGNPGKKPGTKNKFTVTVKETVLAVFNDLQGDKRANLKTFAKKYPRDFYQIAAKLIPTEISGSVQHTVQPFSDAQVNKILSALRQKKHETA